MPPMPDSGARMWHAAADCERTRPGLVGQPVNAASSAAYLVAGAWLLARAERRPRQRRYLLLAAAVAGNGVGGGLYHGPGWAGSRWCHDVAAVAVPLFVAVDGLGELRGWDDRGTSEAYLSAVALASAA